MAQMTQQEAIAKAVKLLKLAQSDNPNEAALAAARAQEIMDRYKLEGLTADYDPSVPNVPEEDIVNFGEPLDPVQNSTWSQRLAVALAEANQCRLYLGMANVNGTWARRPFLVGRPSDVQTVRYLYGWLKGEVNRLAARDGRGYSNIWKNNFRLGAVDTINRKIRESQRATREAVKEEAAEAAVKQLTSGTAEQARQTAIVRVDKALARIEQRAKEVDQWVEQNMKLSKGRGHAGGKSDFGARHAGQKAGEEVDLNRKRPAGELGAAKKQLK